MAHSLAKLPPLPKDKWALLPVLRSCVSSNGCHCLYDGLIRGACICTRVVGGCDT